MMILPFLLGFISHGFDPIINMFQNTPVQWRRLLRYAIGCGDIIASFYFVTRKRQGEHDAMIQSERLTVVVVLTGAGVVAAYMVQEVYQRLKSYLH